MARTGTVRVKFDAGVLQRRVDADQYEELVGGEEVPPPVEPQGLQVGHLDEMIRSAEYDAISRQERRENVILSRELRLAREQSIARGRVEGKRDLATEVSRVLATWLPQRVRALQQREDFAKRTIAKEREFIEEEGRRLEAAYAYLAAVLKPYLNDDSACPRNPY